jgi:spore coat polysaccharide biosynthesis predicted glycosyltransferase SpsG
MKAALFIVDIGKNIGMGHITRELIISRRLKRFGVRSYFYFRTPNNEKNALKNFLRSKACSHIRWVESVDLWEKWLQAHPIDCLIVDTLTMIPERLIKPFKKNMIPIILIGNYLNVPAWANACINTYTAPKFASKRTKRLTGHKWTTLADEFTINRLKKNTKAIVKEAKKIFVLPGAGNTKGMIFKIGRALSSLPKSYVVEIVLGRYFMEKYRLLKVTACASATMKVHFNLNSAQVLKLMKKCDVGILSFGRSLDEARSVGLPVILLSSSNLNAVGSATAAKKGGLINLGDFRKVSQSHLKNITLDLLTDQKRRKILSRAGLRAIDGRGTDRVIHFIQKLANKKGRKCA